MSDVLVTVVVPIYNVEKFLNRCVKSVVDQSYKNLEIILVDDGSPDGCPQMCDEWVGKDPRIKVIHKRNAGLGMARNTGIENANGRYIFFFDSDDYVDSTIVEKCVLSAEKNHADAVIYGRCEVYDDGRIIEKTLKPTKEVYTRREIVNDLLPAMFTYDMGFGVSAWGKMFSLDTIRRADLRFVSEREIISEDAYFALEFFSNTSVVSIVNESLYFYYKRNDSLSRVFRADRHKHNDVFLQRSLAYIREKDLPRKVSTHLTARYHMYMISAMKQLATSNLTSKEKRAGFRELFKGTVLRASLEGDTLKVHKKTLRLFFTLLKLRCYWLCKVMLYLKNQSS